MPTALSFWGDSTLDAFHLTVLPSVESVVHHRSPVPDVLLRPRLLTRRHAAPPSRPRGVRDRRLNPPRVSWCRTPPICFATGDVVAQEARRRRDLPWHEDRPLARHLPRRRLWSGLHELRAPNQAASGNGPGWTAPVVPGHPRAAPRPPGGPDAGMAPVAVGRDVVVFDHAMEPTVFGAIRHELAHGRYNSVHAHGWDKAWRLTDGTPMRGGGVYYDPTHAFDRAGARYPTSSVVDTFIDELRRLTGAHRLVGREGVDSGGDLPLALALPGRQRAVAASRRGRIQRGVHLLRSPPLGESTGVASFWCSTTTTRPRRTRPGVTGWMEDDEVGSALATCVFPQPNRLVFVGPDRPHMVTRVDPNAGDHVRTSLAGFFLRP